MITGRDQTSGKRSSLLRFCDEPWHHSPSKSGRGALHNKCEDVLLSKVTQAANIQSAFTPLGDVNSERLFTNGLEWDSGLRSDGLYEVVVL